MDFYLEIWLRDFAKDFLRQISTQNSESYHPHITLIRPFEITSDEETVRQKIINFCEGEPPIKFSLEGKADFDGRVNYIPVTNSQQLLEFNNNLEQVLQEYVNFAEKLNDEKIFHATVDYDKEIPSCPKIDQYMIMMTAIKKDRIWFSYDFVNQKSLNREQSLDKKHWNRIIKEFLEKYNPKL